MRTHLSRTLLLAGIIQAALLPSILHAQIDRAEINGTITDTTGAAIPGCPGSSSPRKGPIKPAPSQPTRPVTTLPSSLPVGRFTIVIHHAGFNDARLADIDLHADDVRTLNAHLQPGSVTQTVSVEADRGAVQLDKNGRHVWWHDPVGAGAAATFKLDATSPRSSSLRPEPSTMARVSKPPSALRGRGLTTTTTASTEWMPAAYSARR